MKFSVSAALLLCVLVSGCSTPWVTNTPRSAVEQQLLSTAVERAMQQVDLRHYAGKKIYPDYSLLATQTDTQYVKGVFEMHLAGYGITVVPSSEEADYIIQVLSGVLATDHNKWLIGTPELPIPLPDSSINLCIPEISLLSEQSRTAFARFSFNILTSAREPVESIRGINASAEYRNWIVIFYPYVTHNLPLEEAHRIETMNDNR